MCTTVCKFKKLKNILKYIAIIVHVIICRKKYPFQFQCTHFIVCLIIFYNNTSDKMVMLCACVFMISLIIKVIM